MYDDVFMYDVCLFYIYILCFVICVVKFSRLWQDEIVSYCEGEWGRWISGIRIRSWTLRSSAGVGDEMRVMFPLNLSDAERPETANRRCKWNYITRTELNTKQNKNKKTINVYLTKRKPQMRCIQFSRGEMLKGRNFDDDDYEMMKQLFRAH